MNSLRLVCAVWVVLGHAGGIPLANVLSRVGTPGSVTSFIAAVNGVAFNGVAAVMVFFVISGFCIHFPVAVTGRLSAMRFWIRRGLRIGLPLTAAIILSNLLLGRTSALDPVLWSLYCELIYYLIYPGLLKVALAIGWHLVLVISAAASVIVVLFVHNASGFIWNYELAFTWVYGLPVWVSGVVMAELILKPSQALAPSRLWSLRALVWLAASVATVLHFHSPFHYNVSMLAFSPLAFFWVKEEARAAQSRGASKILEIGGKASYSLYLCHMIVLAALALPLRIMAGQFAEEWLACAAFCGGFYMLIESPSHNLARLVSRWMPNERRFA